MPQLPTDLPAGFACPPGRTKPWGTGHAVLAARHAVREPFAVANADDFYGAAAYASLAAFLAEPHGAGAPEYALIGFPLRGTLSASGPVNRALCRADDARAGSSASRNAQGSPRRSPMRSGSAVRSCR